MLKNFIIGIIFVIFVPYKSLSAMEITSIIGTEEKFNLWLAPLGDIHASDYDFSVKAYSNKQANLVIPKHELIMVDDDNFIVRIDTSALGLGKIILEVTAYIPDSDFPDGLRTEIARYTTDTTIIA